MKKVLFFLASLFLGFLLFVLAIQQAGMDNVIIAISSFSISAVVFVFLINAVAICVAGSLRWKIIFESQNKCKISFFKILTAKLAGFSVSYITPSVLVGGEPIRAYMLKEESKCSWEESFASVIIDQAIYFFTLFLFMVIGFLFLVERFSLPIEIFYGFASIIVSALFVFYLFYSKLIKKNDDEDGFFIFIINTMKLDTIKFIRKRRRKIKTTEKIVTKFFKKKKKTFILSFAIAILEIALYVLLVWIISLYLISAVNFAQSTSVFFLLTLANFVPIPGSFGSFEASLTFIFNLLELGKSNGFTFSLIYRFINIALVFIGLLSLLYFELKTISYSFDADTPKIILKLHKFLMRLTHKNK